jgi:hypothetical protein
VKNIKAPKTSLIQKYKKKGTFSILALIPKGLFDPCSCNNTKCNPTTPAIINGTVKCKLKKRFKVGLSTENPPHNNCTIESPTSGIAENKLVITVAPQKLICPQGNT